MSATNTRVVTSRTLRKGGWYIACTLAASIAVLPLFWAFSSSVRPRPEMFQYLFPISWRTFIPENWTLQNYSALLVGTMWPRFVFNTAFVAVTTTAFAVLVNSLAAYALARSNVRGMRAVFVIILIGVIVPFEVIAFPLYLVVQGLGWLDSYRALVMPWVANALSIFLLRQFFLQIPSDLEDAARVDGAGALQTYARVVLPLTWPAHVTVALINFQESWDNFLWPLIATTCPDVRVLQVAIATLMADEIIYWDLLFSAVSVAAIPPIILFLLLQRYYLRGIAMTGMK